MRYWNTLASFFLIMLCLFALMFVCSPVFAEAAESTATTAVQGEETNVILLICTIISSVVIPSISLVAWILFQKGKISKQDKEIADKIAETMANGVEAFKKMNKTESKKLTTVIKTEADVKNVGKELDDYLKKKGLNNGI